MSTWAFRQQGDRLDATDGHTTVSVTDDWKLEIDLDTLASRGIHCHHIPVSVVERLLADRHANVRDAFRDPPRAVIVDLGEALKRSCK